MRVEERLTISATAGVVVGAVGAFLPWARIGGRNRSGFATADLFVGLGSGSLPDLISWAGRWWYVPAVLMFCVWLSVLFDGTTWLRVVAVVVSMLALAMWWLFVWAGWNWSVIDVAWTGPVVTTVGVLVVAHAAASKRNSILFTGTGRVRPSSLLQESSEELI